MFAKTYWEASLMNTLITSLAVAVVFAAGIEPKWQGPGVSVEDLKSLIYADTIPGFVQEPALRGGDGPEVIVNQERGDGTARSRIKGRWRSQDERNSLEVQLWVFETAAIAAKAAEQLNAGATPKLKMPERLHIGDASWSGEDRVGAYRFFILGRTTARVLVYPSNRPIDADRRRYRVSPFDVYRENIADALARGVEWAIRQQSGFLKEEDATERRIILIPGRISVGEDALTLHGTLWAPLRALSQAGARTNWDVRANLATLEYKGKRMELRAFQREAIVDSQPLDLGASVILSPGGPVIPVRKVAESLGMKVEVTPTTLRLE